MSFFQSSIINSSNMSSPSLPTVQSALTSAQQAMSGYTQNIQGSGTMPGMQSLASVIPSGLASNLQGTNSTATGSNPLGMMQGLGNNGNPLSSLSNIGSLNANLLPGNTRKPTGMPAKIQSAALSMDSGIKGFFSNIDNSIDSLFGQNQGKTAKSSVNAVTNSSQFQKGFMGQTAQGYKNSWNNIANATAVKTKTPDPISSSFKAAQKPPISTMVTLKSGTTGMSAMAIGTKTGNANNNIVGDQSTLAKRYGSDIVGGGNYSFRNAADSLFKSNAVSGMFSGLGDVLGSFGSVMGGATMGLNDITSGAIGIAQHVIRGGLGIFQDMMGDVAENVSGSVSGLNGFYDSGLPSVTDSQGNEVPGYSGTSYSTLMSYGGCMDQMGCMTNIGNMALMPYGAMGSAVNALQRILCEEGLFAPLGDLMNCVNMTKYNWENSRRYFYEFSGQDIGVSQVIMENLGIYDMGLGGGGMSSIGSLFPVENESQVTVCLPSNRALLQNIVLNQNLTQTEMSKVEYVITGLGWQNIDPFQTGNTVGTLPVWSLETIGKTKKIVLETLLSEDNDVPMMANGVSVGYATLS